jgi:plastocyanin
MIAVTPRSNKIDKAEIKLKDIIERARENDPEKDKIQEKAPPYQPILSQYISQPNVNKTNQTDIKEDKEDGIRLWLFVGVLIGLVAILCLFGGPYSPLTLLGFTFNAKPVAPAVTPASAAPASNTPIITSVDNTSQNSSENISSSQPEVKTKTVNISISNWRVTPETIKVRAGEKVVLQITSGEMPFDILIDGLGVRDHVDPGKQTNITITPTTPGSYYINAIAWNAGRMTSATTVLVVE